MPKRKLARGQLTPREREVMELLSQGYKTSEIVDVMGISPFTLRTHRATILRRLGANHMAQAMAIYMRSKFDDVEQAHKDAWKDAERVRETWEAHHTIFGKGA